MKINVKFVKINIIQIKTLIVSNNKLYNNV